MVGVERFDKSKLQTADQPKQSLAKSKDMTLVINRMSIAEKDMTLHDFGDRNVY